jgi:hypothetical protein
MKTIAQLARLSWRYLWSRPLATALNLLLLTLGLAAITLVLLVATQIDRAFERDLRGIDLVVGAKGSPLQLILAGVFHIDVPTGNIPLHEVQRLQAHPMVEQVIPLSLGDSYLGHRIVGTEPAYVAHYAATPGPRPPVAATHGGRAGRQRRTGAGAQGGHAGHGPCWARSLWAATAWAAAGMRMAITPTP